MLTVEQAVEGDGLIHITLWRRGGMGVDIVDIAHLQSCSLQGTGHSNHTTVVAGFGDAATIT